ncbi:MAG: hypothetical protein HZC54_09035 [Verrucomicrobia bacterium]|nr:hypothetical protein [Verrucomicrobiota bacterium]
MKRIHLQIRILIAMALMSAAGIYVRADEPKLPNPFRGKVENVTPKNIVVVGDTGPNGSFVVQPGTKITRDGKKINVEQIFTGDSIWVKFTTDKHRGGEHRAVEIQVGKLPGHGGGAKRKSK